MRLTKHSIAAVLCSQILFFCAPDNEDRCGHGYYWEDPSCWEKEDTDTSSTSDLDAGADASALPDPAQWIGSACSCQGDGCEQMGVPVPNGGTIVDCDDVPLTWTGAEKVCLRSYSGDLTSKTYFANGYCSLVALKCEGNSLICASATMGDFDVMATCPKGTALISSVQEVTMGSSQATIHNKTCAVICDQAADCRTGEIDPVFGSAATQYQCLDKDGIRFCFDPRNLPDDFDVQGF